MRIIIALLIIVVVLNSGCIKQPQINNGADLEKTDVPAMPDTIEAKGDLSQIKVAVLYERVTDGAIINRSMDDVISILHETHTDFIFRGWWRWHPCPDNLAQVPEGATLPSGYTHEEVGYTYEHLINATSKIKEEMPDAIFCGAVPAYIIEGVERNPMTGEILDRDKTWAMALDPEKWGIDLSKETYQKEFGKLQGWDYRRAHSPDITNPEFQELLLSWAKKQIDCGADAIWVDMLFNQAGVLKRITGDPHHPAVKESYEAASKIVDGIHDYGNSKGKHIYVGTWYNPCTKLPYKPPDLDFVTATPSSIEIRRKNIDEAKWDNTTTVIRKKFGDIPIFAFIDFGMDDLPLYTFSQELSKQEQKEMLKKMDVFFQKKGIIFVYPIHGGFMGHSAKTLSFSKYAIYDSFSPEFGTYTTLKEIAQNKYDRLL